ncbi:hypothetical protein V6N11_027014 [Hibiscus sabdariffa]|uniref:RNase H type-1 domain-containing protein n=1 Tax=Hibiscus sabdariffa TaxID=183260 RepID=A0ABR2PG24_9ROSI
MVSEIVAGDLQRPATSAGNIAAELWDIYECLKYAWELGVDRLRLESDCGRALQALKDREVRHEILIVHHI